MKVIFECIEEADMEELVALATELVKRDELIAVLCGKRGNGNIVVSVSRSLSERGIKASELIKKISSPFGGSGGGTELLARGGFRTPEAVEELRKRGREILSEVLRAQ